MGKQEKVAFKFWVDIAIICYKILASTPQLRVTVVSELARGKFLMPSAESATRKGTRLSWVGCENESDLPPEEAL